MIARTLALALLISGLTCTDAFAQSGAKAVLEEFSFRGMEYQSISVDKGIVKVTWKSNAFLGSYSEEKFVTHVQMFCSAELIEKGSLVKITQFQSVATGGGFAFAGGAKECNEVVHIAGKELNAYVLKRTSALQ